MNALALLKSFNVKESELKNFLTKNMDELALAGIEFEAKKELVSEIYLRLRDDFGAPDYLTVEAFLKETLIPKMVSVYDLNNINNYDNVVSDIIHEAAGYLGMNLNDDDFSIMLNWVDCSLKFSDYYTIISFKLAGYTLETPCVRGYIERFCREEKFDINTVCGLPPYSHTLASMTITSEQELVYAIMNTALYDVTAVTIVECSVPEALGNYGLHDDEIEAVKKIGVGETFESLNYGKAAIVVRMK